MCNFNLKYKLLISVCKQRGGLILLDIFTYLGSAVTIWCAYFQEPFDIKSKTDWFVAFFIAFILIVLAVRCFILVLKWKSLNFPKEVFFQYLPTQLNKASSSIKSIAGDLSWLKKQKDVYKTIKKEKPQVSIEIYYSEEEVSNNKETQLLFEEYIGMGIKMIPYPFEIQTKHIKGILIDTDENARFLSFTKLSEGDIINCTKYYHNSNEFSLAKSFIDSIGKYITFEQSIDKSVFIGISGLNNIDKSVFIGISGLNNIGKSTLCLELKLKYGEKVVVIEDSFIGDVKQSSFEVALFCLLNQVLEFGRLKKKLSDKTIFIFDRTPIDNLAFLKLYNTTEGFERYIERLESEIKDYMSSFDMIALLVPDEKNYRFSKTSRLGTEFRKKVPSEIHKLYRKIYSEKVTKYKIKKYDDHPGFVNRIKEIVDDIARKINIE